MADIALVGMVLKALGNPSFMVTGRKSGLPGGDKVGTMLSSMDPSLAARLARRSIGNGRYAPIGSGASCRAGAASTSTLIRQKARSASAIPSANCDRIEFSGRCGYRAQPIDSSTASPSTRPFNRSADELAPAAPQPRESCRPLIDWPWQQPLPPSPPVSPAKAYGPTAAAGEIIDLFA